MFSGVKTDNYPFKEKVAACWNKDNPYKPGEKRTKTKLGNCRKHLPIQTNYKYPLPFAPDYKNNVFWNNKMKEFP